MRKPYAILIALLALATVLAAPASAEKPTFPDVIPLPNGFSPEGITIGNGTDFYVGSLADGSIYKGDLVTGAGGLLVIGEPGSIAVGLDFDQSRNLLWVAGGPTGTATAYDATTGELVVEAQLATPFAGFVNDVIVAHDGVYFTNSFAPVFYRLPAEGNAVPDPANAQTIPLSGDFPFVPGGFNGNGIETTPDNEALIIVSSAGAALFRVDPVTGVASHIDVGGDVSFGDGLARIGTTLYVVQNRLDQVAEIKLDSAGETGVLTDVITSSDFRVPTTADVRGGMLFAVNARFGTPPTPDTEYEVVKVRR